MASASSSSGSMPNALRKYDVFISFRGEDTRNNFTSHLHAALNGASLEVFRDDKKLKKGDEIAPSPTQAIKDPSVSIIVFSEDYASSKWCLDELHQIMQFRKEEGQFVIPIFYKVDPKDVRNQTGAYKEAFEKYEKNYQHDPERVIRWRAALSEAGQLSGWGCQTSMDESNLIEEIVAVVCTKLGRIHNCHGTLKDVIGIIDEMVKPIEELLKKSHKVGIWGMGGVGKTTMAKVVFAKLSSQYSHRCFLENVREQTKKKGLKHVRDSLVSKLLGEDKQIDLSDRESVFRRLSRTKAFVVLDDVDTTEQFKNLHDYTCNSLEEGSKVIITTRDRGLLPLKGCEIHEAKGLSYENSRRLFIRKAFGSDNAEDGYEELIKGFVDYAEHNPLALEVLGLYVHSKDKKFWGDLLKDLRAGNPHDDIQKVLKLSYDRLDYREKQIFLDIACFLKGESEEFVKELMESYGFDPTIGMQTLKDKALIDTTNEKVEMHNLIQEMGRQIVFQESIKEPGKRSRLWDSSEISSVLENCEGGEKVEGIILLDRYATGVSYLTAKTFNKMTRLRFLKIHSPWDYDMSTTAGGLESISTQIRYFHWECYPMKSLPSNFCAKHLLELNLAYGKVETLWEGLQDMANLRRLTLKWCLNLRELPDFSQACRLETVDLSCCKSLCYVHASLLSLHSLISLDVRRCISLKGLQSRIPLKSLKEISMDECIVLKEFSVSSKELTSLNLSFTKIEKLGPSIGLCSNLTTLHLGRCLNLTELSDSITQLSSLEKLYLPECPKLTKLPDDMRLLSKLQYLSVRRCTALRSLPELPPSLRTLSATDCTSLETVSLSTISSTPQNKGEKYFSFNNCVKLDLGAIEEQVKLLLAKAAHEKEHVKVYYPGKTVPEWFGNNRKQNDSDPLKLCLSSNTLVGFVFGAVAPDVLNGSIGHLDIVFSVEEDEMTEEVVRSGDFTYGNVLLCSNPKSSESILEKIKGKRRNHDATTYNPNLSFKLCFNGFGFDQFGGHSSNEEFGVYPIYASGRERETPMASASSSSDSVPKILRKYDVFISFGGEDTRNNFTSQLHVALNRASLEVFRDDEKLQKGHETAQAIKDSSVSVIVFSEDYASSKWCLDELHHIMQYRKDEGQFVIPIFYKVEPSDVRNQTGAYKKAFENHEIDYQHDPDRVNRWRAALSKAGKLSGWDCKSSMEEKKLKA